jgi:hypothetical protein
MSVYATQCPMTKRGNVLVPKFDLGIDDPMGRELRHNYGELVWVLEPNWAPWSPGVFDKMKERMKDFKESDYLLLLGNPVLMSMMAVFAGDQVEMLRFLQWSNGGYVPITVEL